MSTTLFVRSYPSDYNWLSLSIKTMDKYLTYCDRTVLMIPIGSPLPEGHEFFDDIIESYMYENVRGYIAQQLDKLDAYKYVDTEHILFSDSDCMYTGPFDVRDRFVDNKPILYITPYSQLPPQGGHWQQTVEKNLGFKPTHECMRSFPILHRTQTLIDLAKDYPKLIDNARSIQDNDFSEFNLIGAYAMLHNHPYHFTEDCQPIPCKQYWSWGGLSEEIQQEIQGFINAPSN